MVGRPINALELYGRIKSEWDKTSQPLQDRLGFLPFGQYQDGSVGLAVPGIVADAWSGGRNVAETAMPAINDDEAWARKATDSFDAAGLAMTGGLGVGLAGGMADNALGSAGGRIQPQGIRAYHGSPHDFDRFSLDKIGTGEGAQAYGHGLYFADREDVARNYRDALTPGKAPDRQIEAQRREVERAADLVKSSPKYQEFYDAQVQKLSDMGRELANVDYSGRMYEVNIKANPEDFLDWDKPLSQQSEAVRDSFVQRAMDAAQRGSFPKADTKIIEDLLSRDVPASEFYTRNRNVFGRAEDASQALREAGIPGIRYLDGMSRGAGEGSSNYVVFDDQLVDILRKYSNAPTGAAIPAGMEASQTDTDPALLEYLRLTGQMPY